MVWSLRDICCFLGFGGLTQPSLATGIVGGGISDFCMSQWTTGTL